MSFDHLASIIFQKNQRVWSVNYMSLKPYFYIAIECCCFQTFKELLAFFATQFFEVFFTWIKETLFEELVFFFQRIAKIRWDTFTSNFFFNYSYFFFAITRLIIKNLFPFFFKSGCKDNQMQMITKFNYKNFSVKPRLWAECRINTAFYHVNIFQILLTNGRFRKLPADNWNTLTLSRNYKIYNYDKKPHTYRYPGTGINIGRLRL
jgi:hypothetical protein